MTKRIPNKHKYLQPSTVNSCFISSRIEILRVTHVDKIQCGNGFSTAYLKLTPKKGYINILIAPNVGFCQSKLDKYKKGELNTNNKIKFIYGGSEDRDIDNCDVVVIVSDSFIKHQDKFANKLIDKVLLDEYHSTERAMSYREVLIEFLDKVRVILRKSNSSEISISTVTATPNLYSSVDIKIANKYMKSVVINKTANRKESIKRAQKLIKEGKDVVICTNDNNTIKLIQKTGKNHLNKKPVAWNYVTGIRLNEKGATIRDIVHNSDSNVTIISGKGFEGVDLDYCKRDENGEPLRDSAGDLIPSAYVFFFEDRSRDYESYSIGTLYQAINRTRAGAVYYEYCRQELSSNQDSLDVRGIIDFVEDTSQAATRKQRAANKAYHNYLIFDRTTARNSVRLNEDAIRIKLEDILYDNNLEHQFDRGYTESKNLIEQFCAERHISFNIIDKEFGHHRMNHPKYITEKTKKAYINRNLKEIVRQQLYGKDFRYWVTKKGEVGQVFKLSNYLKPILDFYLKADWDGNYTFNRQQEIVLEILGSEEEFEALKDEVLKGYKVSAKKKYGKKVCSKDNGYGKKVDIDNGLMIWEFKLKEFKGNISHFLAQWVSAFANKRISISDNWVGNRNYNLAVQTSFSCLKIITNRLGCTLTEVDIVSCYPRLIYASLGGQLGENHYGVNKKNKLANQIALNTLKYNPEKISDKYKQKENKKEQLIKLGWDEHIVESLVEKYFNSEFVGDLLDDMAFLEKQLIRLLKGTDMEPSAVIHSSDNSGCIIRHDSVIIINNRGDLSKVNDLVFLGQTGWFDMRKSVPVIEMQPIEFNDEEERIMFELRTATGLDETRLRKELNKVRMDKQVEKQEEKESITGS